MEVEEGETVATAVVAVQSCSGGLPRSMLSVAFSRVDEFIDEFREEADQLAWKLLQA